eukprot:6210395-Pleurochrysis_carterae.AAC.1
MHACTHAFPVAPTAACTKSVVRAGGGVPACVSRRRYAHAHVAITEVEQASAQIAQMGGGTGASAGRDTDADAHSFCYTCGAIQITVHQPTTSAVAILAPPMTLTALTPIMLSNAKHWHFKQTASPWKFVNVIPLSRAAPAEQPITTDERLTSSAMRAWDSKRPDFEAARAALARVIAALDAVLTDATGTAARFDPHNGGGEAGGHAGKNRNANREENGFEGKLSCQGTLRKETRQA